MYKIQLDPVNGIRKFIALIGNLKLAIFLLLTIAVCSGIGTIIEQDQPISFYEVNYPFTKPILGIINSDLILSLGLDRVYTTWWFFSLIFLFGFSLLSCTFSRQIPSLKLAKLWKFLRDEQNVNKFNLAITVNDYSLAELAYFLRQGQYNIIQQGNYLYAYKGLIGKIGPILVHISIIFILLGSVYGSLAGFMLQEIIPTRQLFHLQNTINSGPISYIDQTFQAYINDFKIAYTDEGLIDQFYSDISVVDQNLEAQVRKTIFVNQPLKYNELTIYQTDWNISTAKFLINGQDEIETPVKEIKLKNNSRFWITVLPSTKNILIVIQDLTGQYLIYNQDTVVVGEGELGATLPFGGQSIRLVELIPATGLQIKSDPGIPIVYVGFFFLIISASISYTSYCQIWAIKKSNTMYVYGITNRGVYFFEKNLIHTLRNLKKIKRNI